ncbi:MAG: efflux RND transporter periplasmic adaptor subunit [Nitratireductor sp.]|nr:efflux RND transporter periplasmic adaptor subunit [Nitratireductor sp.]
MVDQTNVPEDVARTLGLDDAASPRRIYRRLAVYAALAIVVLGAVYWFWWREDETAGALRYVTQNVRTGALTQTVTATGTVEPTNQVEISSELSGTVKEVLVDYNDEVASDQVLARLDTAKLQAEVDNAAAALAVKQAQLQEAEATLSEAQRAYQRSLALTEKSFVSRASQDTAEANQRRAEAGIEVAKANIEVARASLKTAETNLKKATIRSPIKGVVMSRSVEPGQTVAASLQAPVLFTLAEDLASMQLEVDIDEADIGTVHSGQKGTFTVEAYQDRNFPAELKEVRIAPEEINGVVTYTGVLTLDNTDMALLPGMTATAEIVVKHIDNALLVPNAALRYAPPAASQSGNGNGRGLIGMLMPRPPRGASVAKVDEPASGARSVYVLEAGEPKKLDIRVGSSDGNWTEVLDGPLKDGMAVVTDSRATK